MAVDLFCGAGGLTRGLQDSGIEVVAGIDLDPHARYAYEHNNGVPFVQTDVASLSARRLREMYPKGSIRLLAGCAPCTPYSSLKNGTKPQSTKGWRLLDEFARLIRGTKPHVVTMENVPKLRRTAIYSRFVKTLERLGYRVDAAVLKAELYDVPQRRRRLVLVASRLGEVNVPKPRRNLRVRTVRDAIHGLPRVAAGKYEGGDRFHRAAGLRRLNARRIRASSPGGSWRTWRKGLKVACHGRGRGRRFTPVYGRMQWGAPSPTITTQAFNYGSGRFGHPSQARAISLREAALLQTFPRRYQFSPPGSEVSLKVTGRLIGNAVPVRLGKVIGKTIRRHVRAISRR